jgi:hypothetical protein
MSIKILLLLLLLYISWVSPYTTKKIKTCGEPRDSAKIRSSSEDGNYSDDWPFPVE